MFSCYPTSHIGFALNWPSQECRQALQQTGRGKPCYLWGGDPVSFHGNEVGTGRSARLFNIARDPGETIDLASAKPERTRVMLQALDAALSSKGTRPGG
jgi:hypothetical protein